MDKCSKFKMFNVLLVFCVANFLLYRYFSQDGTHFMSGFGLNKDKLDSRFISQAIGNISSNMLKFTHAGSTISQGDITSTNISKGLNATQHGMQDTDMPLCPLIPPRLNGALATYTEGASYEEIGKENPGLKPGGRSKPSDCKARHRVAIVIPYRNREKHLKILLKNLHPMLARQQLDYGIYVIDQAFPGKFNRAMLMNIGYAEAMKRYDYQCAVFHDVDLIPENDKNIYSCPEMPRHLSAAIDKFNYRLPYTGIYGGVSAVSKEQFEKLNGFSNMFFGWGGEDDDMASRFALLKTTTQRMATDGLNSLVYTVQMVEELPTHLRIQVLINESDILKV